MPLSIKEQISTFIEARLNLIKAGFVIGTYTCSNSVSYVDRQYYEFTEKDFEDKAMPWIILNCDGEDFGPQMSRRFDNTIFYDIVGFVKASKDDPNLDTLMNSLQQDILSVILTDMNLSGLASQIIVRRVTTVSEMVWPFGGFIITLEVNYSFIGPNV